ncbi:MAG: restriction endonuclease [Armatimonadetes bacterium]|nr:restriction endonuclease [Armatimonadota bacterium]
MSGEEFERALRQILEREGWAVELTPRSNDFGADLVIHRQGRRVVVQAKRWRRPAGIKSVQEAAGARDRYRADEAWVVSPSGFTRSAVEQARASRVRLKDGDWLLANLKVPK